MIDTNLIFINNKTLNLNIGIDQKGKKGYFKMEKTGKEIMGKNVKYFWENTNK